MRIGCGVALLALSVVVSSVAAQKNRADSPGRSGSLKRIGGRTFTEWEDDLRSADAGKRAEALVAMTIFSDENAHCVPQLLKMVRLDKDVSPRVRAMIALRLVTVDDKLVPSVISTLAGRLDAHHESQAIARLEAAITLERFSTDPAMERVISELSRGALDRSSWQIRHRCVGLLWRAGLVRKSGADPKIYETLLTVLSNDRTYLVRLEVLQGLGRIGRPGNPALLAKVTAALNSAARSENKGLAIWAYSALVAMQEGELSKAPLAKIASFLKSPRLETRIQAAYALGGLNKRAKSKVPQLIAMLRDPEENAVWAAASALAGIGDSSDAVVDALMELVDHKDPNRATAGVVGLRGLKVKTSRVTGVLDKMLAKSDLDRRLRWTIEETLKEFKSDKKGPLSPR